MDPKHSHGPDRVDYQETSGDLTEVHASIQRENPEPTAQVTPIPMWLTITCGVAVCWAGLYLGFFNGGLKSDVFNELSTTASLMFPAPSTSTGTAAAVAELSLAEQGKAVYANCVACHQPAGTGTPGTIPPLAQSTWVTNSEKRLAAVLLKGLTGPITVNGAVFNNVMPAWEGQLSNKKLAAVASYIRASFGNNAPPISEAQMAAARKEFEAHKAVMTEADLLKIPEDATLPGGDAAGGAAAPSGNAVAAPAAPAGGAAATASATSPASASPAPATPAAATPAAAAAPAPPAPGSAPAPAAPADSGPVPTPRQIGDGKKVYMMVCFACHQPTGMGLPMVFPPLVKSPYVSGSPERLVAIILKGNIGPFTIDGKPYNNVMPAQEATLDDKKIADVATYVRNDFGNKASGVTPEMVAAARTKFADRKTSWTQAELDAWKD